MLMSREYCNSHWLGQALPRFINWTFIVSEYGSDIYGGADFGKGRCDADGRVLARALSPFEWR